MLSDFNRSLEIMDRMETDYIRLLCYNFPPGFKDIYRAYEYSRFCTLIQGEKIISADGKEPFRYGTNQYLLLAPESQIHMEMQQPTKAIVYELNMELVRKVNRKVNQEYLIEDSPPVQNFYLGERNIELTKILNEITSKAGKKNSEFLIDLYAQELVYHLVRDNKVNQLLNSKSNHPVMKSIRYMKENYRNLISIKQIADELHMSEANFCQYFKKITGMTPNRYLTKLKLRKAKEMLKQTSVTEVALDLGYENISYFISLFKKEFGVTPKQYQNQKNHFVLQKTE